jgi:glycosyltransferase involved in cell wall biosynthesis
MSLLEAMALGVLCVTTPVGSIPEVIINRENGLLVEKSNPTMLANVLEEIVLSPREFIPLADQGMKTVKQRFNGEVYKAALQKIYKAV